MNKALLTIVCAAMASSAFAATPIDLTAEITTGDVQETLKQFNLKFYLNGDAWVDMSSVAGLTVDETKKVTVKGNGLEVTSSEVKKLFGSLINVTLETSILKPGQYEIIVPEGLVTSGSECNKAMTLTVTVTGSNISMSQNEYMQYFVMNPADGSQLDALGSFTLVGTTRFTQDKAIDATLKCPDGTVYQSGADFLADNTQVQYRFSAPSNAKGAYVLTIPESTLKSEIPGIGEVKNPQLVFNYTVRDAAGSANAVDVDYAVSDLNPTRSADSFSSFFIDITDGDDPLGPFIINSDLLDKVKVESATAAFRPSAVVNVENDPKAIELRFATPITAGGTYSITLPQGLLIWDSFTNTEIVIEDAFTCTGEVIDYFTQLDWFTGTTWTYKTPLPASNEVSVLTSLWGTFANIPDGVDLKIPSVTDDDEIIGTAKATVVLPSGQVVERTIQPLTQDAHSFKVTIYTEGIAGYKEEGDYKVTIPAGIFNVNGSSNPEIVKVITIKDNNVYVPVDLDLISVPDSGLPLEKLTYISWTFNNVDSDDSEIYTQVGVKPNVKATVTPKDGVAFEVPIESYNTVYSQLGFAIDLNPDIDVNGEYTVSVPEGAFRIKRNSDGQLCCNKAFSKTYIVKNSGSVVTVEPSITPAPGAVASLARFDLYRPTGYNMYLPEPVKDFTLELPDGSSVAVTPSTNANVEGEMVFVYLPQTYTATGEYTLTIPAGGLELMTAAGQPVNYAGGKYVYTVKDFTPVDLAFTADPADGSNIYWLQYVYVKFDEPVTNTVGMQATVTNPAGETEPVTTSFNKQNNRFLLNFGYNSALGKYIFTIPEGIVTTEDGRTNKEFQITYNYIERKVEKIDFAFTPGEGKVASLDKVTMEAPAKYVKVDRADSGNTKVEVSVTDEETFSVYVREGDNARQFVLEFPEAVTVKDNERKDVSIAFPEGTFILTDEDGIEVVSAAMRANWSVDPAGVAEVFGDADSFTVYTLDGKCLLNSVEAAALETLNPGIYVINGKTVMLR